VQAEISLRICAELILYYFRMSSKHSNDNTNSNNNNYNNYNNNNTVGGCESRFASNHRQTRSMCRNRYIILID